MATAFSLALHSMLAQMPTSADPNHAAQMEPPVSSYVDSRGPCLDSAKAVPGVLGEPNNQGSEVVRIDKLLSQATYTPQQIIGFLYTREDGKTYLGMRTLQYTSPASAQELNAVLASTRAPGTSETQFPPQTKLGVATRYTQFFEVKIPTASLKPLQIRLEPCVAWPASRPLPDPGPGP